jgi:integrase
LCGLRRGEIIALRWQAIDLDLGQLAVIASTEQTDAGTVREKEAKSGRSRTIVRTVTRKFALLLAIATSETRQLR